MKNAEIARLSTSARETVIGLRPAPQERPCQSVRRPRHLPYPLVRGQEAHQEASCYVRRNTNAAVSAGKQGSRFWKARNAGSLKLFALEALRVCMHCRVLTCVVQFDSAATRFPRPPNHKTAITNVRFEHSNLTLHGYGVNASQS